MRRWLIALVVAAGGCPGDDPPCAGPLAARAISYNVANRTGDEGDRIAAQIAAAAPDFVAAQECDSCDYLLGGLPARYRLVDAPRAGVALLYDAARWRVDDHGVVPLGDDDDGWGERVAVWARLADPAAGGCLYLYSTHFCVPIRSPDDACDLERQLEVAALLVDEIDRRAAGAPALVAGDLNVFDGFEEGPVVGFLLAQGWVDVFRVADPLGDGTTFQGNEWAPAGRLDYLFATPPVDVGAAAIDRETVPAGEGSDHYPVMATVILGE
jgi:endonuclease/exonuclease/phosphatase family metal-dependent hydrolase